MNFLFLILFFTSNLLFGGFSKDTLVFVPDGFTKISNLQVDDYVVSDQVINRIIATRSCFSREMVSILVEGVRIDCALNQQFYVPQIKKWVRARDLKIGCKLLNYDLDLVEVTDVSLIFNKCDLSEISVSKSHTYFVSSKKVLTHNFAVSVGLSWAFGSGVVEFAGATLCGMLGLFGIKVVKDLTGGSRQNWETQILIEQDKLKQVLLQEAKSKKKPKSKPKPKKIAEKTFEDILKEAEPGDKTNGKSKIYVKPDGSYKDALGDFESLCPDNIVSIEKGKRGVLSDGRDVNVRWGSKDSRSTLEVQQGRKKTKIRYGNK